LPIAAIASLVPLSPDQHLAVPSRLRFSHGVRGGQDLFQAPQSSRIPPAFFCAATVHERDLARHWSEPSARILKRWARRIGRSLKADSGGTCSKREQCLLPANATVAKGSLCHLKLFADQRMYPGRCRVSLFREAHQIRCSARRTLLAYLGALDPAKFRSVS